jgi:hypothetical protein
MNSPDRKAVKATMPTDPVFMPHISRAARLITNRMTTIMVLFN